MCNFCEPDKFGGGKEITKQIAFEPIGMGQYENVLRLEAWIMSNEKGENPKLQISLCTSYGEDEIQTVDIPIKYCPNCGREL